MRISINPNDPGYVNFRRFCRARVFLDDVEIRDVLTADEEKGEVDVVCKDRFGNVQLNKDTGFVVHEIVTGDVRVEMPA